MMQCHFCAGEMKQGKATYTLDRADYHLLIHDVPAWICAQCKEDYFEENVVEVMQEMIKKLDVLVNKVRQAAVA
ncbi:Uncharacterised protein [uncultured archaeon]|nr:Uncharacterised protein [uncultured archaeon]